MVSARFFDRSELRADLFVHVIGLSLGVLGVGVLVPRIAQAPSSAAGIAIAIYCIGLLMMLGFSAAYNLWPPSPRREFLRRCDHASIFVMIAATYSPFTFTGGPWPLRLGIAVWIVALLGVAMKLAFPRRFDRLAIVAYLLLGWIGVVAIVPLLQTLSATVLILLGIGGLLYSAGVMFHLWRRLRFQNAIWHGFVLAAAICQYVAVLLVS